MEKIRLGSKSSLYPYPVTIISTEIDGRKNFMNLGFVGIVNANPGMIAMGIGRHHLTTKALQKNTVFAIALPNEKMMLKADLVGIRSGLKVDKSNVFNTVKGDHGSNLIVDAPINLELVVKDVLDYGGVDYTIIAEILEVYADESVMSGKNPDIEKIKPLIFSMYENRYFTLGNYVGNGWRSGLEYEKLESFVKDVIFPAFDELRDNEFFKQFIDDDSTFIFDDKEYVGFGEFSEWLNGMRDVLESSGLTHEVLTFDATQLEGNLYQVKFRVKTDGTMKDGSSFDMLVNETWVLKKVESNYVFVSYNTSVE